MDWRTRDDATYESIGRGVLILKDGIRSSFSGPHLICKFCGRWLATKKELKSALSIARNNPTPSLLDYTCVSEDCQSLGAIEGTKYND
jgi:hypothetical protein